MKGFTFIEIIIAFAITSILAGVSLTSFTSYNQSQVFGNAAADFSELVKVARSQAISQIKPSSCGSLSLDGYKIKVTLSGQDYEEDVMCGGSSIVVQRRKLPPQLSFGSGSVSSVLFDVSMGTVSSPGSIMLNGFGKTTTIIVDRIGNLSIGAP